MFFSDGSVDDTEPMIKHKMLVETEPVIVNMLAMFLLFVFIAVSYVVRRESIKRRSNNRSPYTATVSPLRVKSPSSSTGKFGSVKQSSVPPV